jgi:hypothetical protein
MTALSLPAPAQLQRREARGAEPTFSAEQSAHAYSTLRALHILTTSCPLALVCKCAHFPFITAPSCSSARA